MKRFLVASWISALPYFLDSRVCMILSNSKKVGSLLYWVLPFPTLVSLLSWCLEIRFWWKCPKKSGVWWCGRNYPKWCWYSFSILFGASGTCSGNKSELLPWGLVSMKPINRNSNYSNWRGFLSCHLMGLWWSKSPLEASKLHGWNFGSHKKTPSPLPYKLQCQYRCGLCSQRGSVAPKLGFGFC